MIDLLTARVTTVDGESHALGELVAGRPSVVVFLRHFGCVGCSAHVSELSPRVAQLARLGVAVVFIGNGSTEQLAGFVERHALSDRDATFATDPGRDAYRAARLERSAWGIAGPRALVNQARLIGAGYYQGSIQGDARQQGGAFVLDADGTVLLRHDSTAIGDNASGGDLVAAAMRAVAQRAASEGIV